jgi:hypothetical protein
VTVFAAVALSALLLFFSVLIDYARVAAFHKLGETAARAGIRSVLSAYDSFLYDKYGLFGRGGTDGEQLFREVVQANAEGSYDSILSQSGSVKPIRMKLEETKLNSSAFLGSHTVFKRQVLEEMKYKAPVDFTLDIVAKFAPIASAMEEATATVDLLENLRKLYERREAHLARVLELQEQAASATAGSGLDAMLPVGSAAHANGGNTVTAVASEYTAYANQAMLEQEAQDSAASYSQAVSEYEAKAKAVAADVRSLTSALYMRHEQLQREAVQELDAASRLNEQMKATILHAQAEARGGGYDQVARSGQAASDGQSLPANTTAEIDEIRQTADELLREDSWFASYKQELHDQGSDLAVIDTASGKFQSSSLASLAKPISSASNELLADEAVNLRKLYAAYEEQYINPGTVLEHRRQALEQGDARGLIKEHEERAGSLWKQARDMLGGFADLPRLDEHRQQFLLVQERYEQNLRFNQAIEQAEEGASVIDAADAHDAAASASTLTGSLFGGMAGVLERSRDALYAAEYVMARYAYFAPQQLRAMLLGGNLSELGPALAFNNQEAEYVLYGFHDPAANLAAAYGQLFAARLAVRTMEGLMESRSLGHPLVILAAALVYGLEKTLEDMFAFAERGSAPLSKYVRVELAYTDYMRLFLLANPSNESNRLARMIAVIEHNSGVMLAAVPSGVSGEARLSMKLWFVPGLTGMLGRIGLLDGKVVGSRYEAVQTLGSSY